jgi:hypothetical protein
MFDMSLIEIRNNLLHRKKVKNKMKKKRNKLGINPNKEQQKLLNLHSEYTIFKID